MVGMRSWPSSFTGTKLALVSPFKDADQWDKAMFGLDLSAEKQFKNGISIFFKANNLLDAKRKIRSEIVKSDYNIIARLNKRGCVQATEM